MKNGVVEYFGGTISKDKEIPSHELFVVLNERFIDNIMAEGGLPNLAEAFSSYIIEDFEDPPFSLRRILKLR